MNHINGNDWTRERLSIDDVSNGAAMGYDAAPRAAKKHVMTFGTYDIAIRLHGETLQVKYNYYPGDEYHPQDAREPVMVTLHGVDVLPLLINYEANLDDIERAILDAEHAMAQERAEI